MSTMTIIPDDDLTVTLAKHAEQIHREIVSLAGTDEARKRMRELLAKLEHVNKLRSVPAVDAKKYATFRRPIDAVVAYLEEIQRAAEMDEIIRGVLAGGFRGGSKDQTRFVSASLNVFINPEATGSKGSKNPLRVKDGKIGLKHWPDSLFDAD